MQAAFDKALGLEGAAREEWLRAEFAGEPELGEEVRQMLAAHETGERLLLESRLVHDAAPRDDSGRMAGPYRLVRLVGRGGMGEVYEARREDPEFPQPVALKLLSTVSAPELVKRFRRERLILARLQHPNIAALLDGGVTAEGRPYLVLQYVEGVPITTYCKEQALPIEARLRLFLDVARAVDHAHRKLVVHRDLKPSNILVTAERQVRLLDFGIAKLIGPGEADEHPLTRTEVHILTPEYAAPEQLTGGEITTATDVHGLGLLLYEMLTEVRPYPMGPDGLRAWEQRVVRAMPAPPSSHDGRLRGDLDAVILKALEKEPEARYSSVLQMAADVERWLGGHPVEARSPSRAYYVRKFVSRNKLASSLAAVALGLLLALVGTSWYQSARVRRERDAALAQQRRAEGVVRVLTELFASANPKVLPGGRELTVGQFLERVESTVLQEGALDGDVKAQLKHVLGQVYLERSQYDKARGLLDEAVAGFRQTRGEDDPQTVTAIWDRARLSSAVDAPPEALRRLREAMARIRRVFGEQDRRVALCIHEMLQHMDGTPEFKRMADEELAIERAASKEPTRGLALALEDQGIYCGLTGNFRAELQYEEEAWAILDKLLPPGHPDRWVVLDRLAMTHDRLHEQAVAIGLQRRILAEQEKYLGLSGHEAGIAYNNLGIALVKSGRFAEGEKYLRAGYERFRAVMPKEHRELSNALRNIGRCLQYERKDAEALRYLTEALAMEKRLKSPELAVLGMEGQVAVAETRVGRRAEGLRRLRRAAEELARLQPDGYWRSELAARLGFVLLGMGAEEEAARWLRPAAQRYGQTLEADHPKRLEAECGLGLALGRTAEGRGWVKRSCGGYLGWAAADPVERAVVAALVGR